MVIIKIINNDNNGWVRGSNSTAALLHISQNIIAQRIISLFNGRSLRLPKGSPFRNPQKPIQEKPKKPKPRKTKKKKKKKKKQKNKRTKKKQYFGNLGNSVAIFQESRNIGFLVLLVFFGFFGFVFFWFFLDWFCGNLEISLIPLLYYCGTH